MRKLGSALVLVGIAALPGCGGGKQYATVPAREVIAAASTTQSVPSERIHQEGTLKGGPQTLHTTSDGMFDNKRKIGRATIDLSGTPAGDQHGEYLVAGPTTFYMRLPALAKETHKPWAKVDLQAVGKQHGIDFSSLMGGSTGDPSSSLDELRAASGKVQVIGSEVVRGVHTSHYRATIDLRKEPALLPASKRAAARRSIDAILKLGSSPEIKTDIWVSPADKRVHRMETQYSYKIQGHKVQMDQTVDLFDFGVKVPPVTPPPASQTADLAKLAAGAKP